MVRSRVLAGSSGADRGFMHPGPVRLGGAIGAGSFQRLTSSKHPPRYQLGTAKSDAGRIIKVVGHARDTDCLVQVKQGMSACNPRAQPLQGQAVCFGAWVVEMFSVNNPRNNKIVTGHDIMFEASWLTLFVYTERGGRDSHV